MKKLKEYNIGFKGLKDGMHTFEYTVGKDFFSLFENALYDDGDIKVYINMNKSDQLLILDYNMHGTISSICDNCLEPLDYPIDCQSKLYVKFGEEYDEPSEEIIVLPRDDYEFNVGKTIYELIATSLPIRHLHEPDEDGNSNCNPEMTETLSQYLVDNTPSNEERAESQDENDPRWDELKKLLDKNK